MDSLYFTYDYNLPYKGQIDFLEEKIKSLKVECDKLQKELEELLTVKIINQENEQWTKRIDPVNFSKAIRKGALLEFNTELVNTFTKDLESLKSITSEEYDKDCITRKEYSIYTVLDKNHFDFHWKNHEGYYYKYKLI